MQEQIHTKYGSLIAILENDGATIAAWFSDFPQSVIIADNRNECINRLHKLAEIILSAQLYKDLDSN
jgi:hypothetical protein